MPRSNWKGSISFGMVSIPIMLFNSIEPSSRLSLKQINKKTGSSIQYRRVDAVTGKEVAWENIGKGYQYEKDVIVPLEDKELKHVAGTNAKTIAIEEFIDKKNIDFIAVENTYYIVPDKNGNKGYVILREALKDSNKVGIAKVIISTREYVAAVATHENALVLYLLHYANEIRSLSTFEIPSDQLKAYKVNAKEIDVAKKLINSMASKWKPEKYKDEYKVAVEKRISEKLQHLPATKMKSRPHAKIPNVVDFVELLKLSLNKSKSTQSRRHTKLGKNISRKSASHRKAAHH